MKSNKYHVIDQKASKNTNKLKMLSIVLIYFILLITLPMYLIYVLHSSSQWNHSLSSKLNLNKLSLSQIENDLQTKLLRYRSLIDSSSNQVSQPETIQRNRSESFTSTNIESNLMPKPIQFHSLSIKIKKDESMLVVGGTDGSGTRRVVQILTDLGVTMVSEDPETYDIHADIVGGWPPVVSKVISHTKSLNYNVDDIPTNERNDIMSSISMIIDLATKDSHKPTSYIISKGKLTVHTLDHDINDTIINLGGVLPKMKNTNAKGILFGFKAPVAMTLVPFWEARTLDFKFLHVLRDGRDIAFSANQGPVDKFFPFMYGQSHQMEAPPIKAIRLWSDWNSQIYHWAKSRSTKQSANKSFGYLAIHSEDLINDEVNVRFNAIRNLAKWVDSNLSLDDLCCLAMKDSKFMGSHDRTDRKEVNAEQLSSRYGKWRSFINNDVALFDSLHSAGKEGLEIFGYEPKRRLAEPHEVTENGYGCKMTFQECQNRSTIEMNSQSNENENQAATFNLAAKEAYSLLGKCDIFLHGDFKGGMIHISFVFHSFKLIM